MDKKGWENYDIVQVPKFVFSKNSMDWTKREARKYKEWVSDNYQARAEYLIQYLKTTDLREDILSAENKPEILILIWSWFLQNYSLEKRGRLFLAAAKMQMITFGAPDRESCMDSIRYKLTEKSEAVAIDIGFYFADYLIKHCAGVKWVFVEGPEGAADINLFLLAGFSGRTENGKWEIYKLDPLKCIGNLCASLWDEKEKITDHALYDVYLEILDSKVSFE